MAQQTGGHHTPGVLGQPEPPSPCGSFRVGTIGTLVRKAQSENDFTLQVETRLRDVRRDAEKRIGRIRLPSLLVGSFLLSLGCLFHYLALVFGVIGKEFGSIGAPIGGFGGIAMILALVPTQPQSIWMVTIAFLICGLSVIGMNAAQFLIVFEDPRSRHPLIDGVDADPPDWYVLALTALFPVKNVGVAAFFVAQVRLLWWRLPPRRHIEVLWRVSAFTFFWFFLQQLLEAVVLAPRAAPGICLAHCCGAACFAAQVLLFAKPGLRVRIQAWLAEQGSSTSVATAVGALVCSRPLRELLLLAKERMRCVPLDRVTRAMMAGKEPDPALAAFSEPAVLGEVDAFLSHSWSDDPEAKWEALQEWRAEFRAGMGREPRVWIDKFCIDQADIADCLAGLPIFLAGCDKLVVLYGETYGSRLWCLLEIFTFVVMGGSRKNLQVRRLRTCEADFGGFDARGATCASEADTSHLLGIIEAGLGSLDNFNEAVSKVVGTPLAAREAESGNGGCHLTLVPGEVLSDTDEMLWI